MHDHELDLFKRDIHLVQYAVRRHGYTRDRRESSRNSHVLRHPGTNDKIVVRQADDHWTYFSVRDDRDNGTIIDFLQHRGVRSLGEVRQLLRDWLGMVQTVFDPVPIQVSHRSEPSPSAAVAFEQARSVDNSPYLNVRGIRPKTL